MPKSPQSGRSKPPRNPNIQIRSNLFQGEVYSFPALYVNLEEVFRNQVGSPSDNRNGINKREFIKENIGVTLDFQVNKSLLLDFDSFGRKTGLNTLLQSYGLFSPVEANLLFLSREAESWYKGFFEGRISEDLAYEAFNLRPSYFYNERLAQVAAQPLGSKLSGRRAVIPIYHPGDALRSEKEQVPCLIAMQFLLRGDSALYAIFFWRSVELSNFANDIFLTSWFVHKLLRDPTKVSEKDKEAIVYVKFQHFFSSFHKVVSCK